MPVVQDAGMAIELAETASDIGAGRPDALQQVFGNLVENATKYGRSGGKIRMGARAGKSGWSSMCRISGRHTV